MILDVGLPALYDSMSNVYLNVMLFQKENSFHEDESKVKKAKRNTFEVIKDEPRKTRQSASPGVKGMLDSLKPEMSNDQMKNSLMAALNKNVEEKSRLMVIMCIVLLFLVIHFYS
jgi:hypothetical protein